METKQYADRDIMGLDRQGGHFSRHMSAMTGEDLHSKPDIAAELAWRDSVIEAHDQRLKRIEAVIQEWERGCDNRECYPCAAGALGAIKTHLTA